MKNRMVKGVAINDADYAVQKKEMTVDEFGKKRLKLVWCCPFYRRWSLMLERCYSVNPNNKRKSYKGCTVCEEWLIFSNFKAWMETQDWEGKCLDKDLLVSGNRTYSPETCIFISRELNSFLTDRASLRGRWPLGVDIRKNTGKFRASCSNPFTLKQEHLGVFDSPEDAHNAWLSRKREFAKVLAEGEDTLIAEALIKRYEDYKTTK